MLKYRPFEMHCHTRHSDGTFLVPQLLESATAYGFEGLALTDHNAVTGLLEVTPELEARTCPVIPGIEWTTFFGHMLVLGCSHFVDWRFVTPDTIDDALLEIQAAGGVAGVAHPCEVGAPLMCGCHWDFRVTRWDLVDYVEIWNGDDPHMWAKNSQSIDWYNALLNRGYHLPLTAGRDWHGPDRPGHVPVMSATYLGLDGDVSTANALSAIRAGRSYVTLGPTLDVALHQNGQTFGLGQTARPGPAVARVTVGMEDRRAIWDAHQIRPQFIRLTANGQTLAEQPYTGEAAEFSLPLVPGWLRVELHGTVLDRETDSIALTSPIYISDERGH